MARRKVKKSESDLERYNRLAELYRFKVDCGSNPIEIGWKDMEWLLAIKWKDMHMDDKKIYIGDGVYLIVRDGGQTILLQADENIIYIHDCLDELISVLHRLLKGDV